MNTPLRIALDEAFFHARTALYEKAPSETFLWLERAHILSQHMPVLHARSHWLMLRAGWQLRDYREMLGQAPRIIAAVLFSKIWVPLGNSGRQGQCFRTIAHLTGVAATSSKRDAMSSSPKRSLFVAPWLCWTLALSRADVAATVEALSTSGHLAIQLRMQVRQLLRLPDPPISDPRLTRITAALREGQIGREAMAALVHLSPMRFSHWFEEQTGLPLRSYLSFAINAGSGDEMQVGMFSFAGRYS